MKYADKIASLRKDDFQKELKAVCEEAGADWHKYRLFLIAGGSTYVIEHLAGDLYMSRKPINKSIRHKIRTLHAADRASLTWANDNISRADNSWTRRQYEEEREKALKKFREVLCTKY